MIYLKKNITEGDEMKDYAMIIMAVVLLVVDFTLQKLYQKKMGVGLKSGLLFNFFVGIITAVIFLFINGFKITFSPYSAVMACMMSTLLVSYVIIGFRIMKAGNMAYYTLALMAGGMLVPYVFGLLFLNEDFSVLRLAGVVLVLFAVIASNSGGGKSNLKNTIMCAAVFVLNGFVSVVSKLQQTDIGYTAVSATEFVFYTGIVRALLCGIVLCVIKFREKKTESSENTFKIGILPITIGSALVSGVSYMLQLLCASNLPATILYPFVTGGTIILSALAGVIFFKDKLSKKTVISIAVCFIGTCLFL